jgi:transcriptional regulator with XRE-family HTH domain
MTHAIRFLGFDPRPVPGPIGQRLRHYRESRAVSPEAMARQLGIDTSTLARWERGSCQPQGKFLARVEAVLAE